MPGDFPSTYESALSVVATAMKKARLRLDVLIVNSLMGGILFTTGGMLQILIESGLLPQVEENYGLVRMIVSMFSFGIGLFYVVILGLDLFNSNILFFSAAYCRGAVSILDIAISWLVSYSFNLVGTLFVCFVIVHFSAVGSEEAFVTASQNIVLDKASYSFVQNLLKAMAGNFYVCLGIYLQNMVRPLHVKFLLLNLAVYTFVCIGYSHAVADMFLMIMGTINDAPVPMRTLVWKLFVPVTIGNIIGGSFFGAVIVWYLHIFAVEQDQDRFNFPTYNLKDELPQQNIESRVVREKLNNRIDEEDDTDDLKDESQSTQAYIASAVPNGLGRIPSRVSAKSRKSSASTRTYKSPKNVFPVAGMGTASEYERLIAGHRPQLDNSEMERKNSESEYMGATLMRAISRISTRRKAEDSEAQSNRRTSTSGEIYRA